MMGTYWKNQNHCQQTPVLAGNVLRIQTALIGVAQVGAALTQAPHALLIQQMHS